MYRRDFVQKLFVGGTLFALSGCGGGGGSSSASALVSAEGLKTKIDPTPAVLPPAPAPAPPPTEAAPVAPVASLRGVSIDQAESEIREGLAGPLRWQLVPASFQSDVVVRSVDELQKAIDAAFQPQSLALRHRISCAWDGISKMASAADARLNISGKVGTSNHLAAGGSVLIRAADGYRPLIWNTAYVSGRGIVMQDLHFARQLLDGEKQDSTSAVILVNSDYFPNEPFVAFSGCKFGGQSNNLNSPLERWINGVSTQGLAEAVLFTNCEFFGTRSAAKIIARAAVFTNCDFRQVFCDGIDLFSHTKRSDYYAYAWVDKCTFRDVPQTWEGRTMHRDAVQTGTPADIHKGYRVLYTDTIIHSAQKFGGTASEGGGSQGFFNSDHAKADNQFVVRRCIILATIPHGFRFYSPSVTRPSFVDQCTFTRAGTVPSKFGADTADVDWASGLTGLSPGNGPWLSVTNTITKNMFTGNDAVVDIVSVDPRIVGPQAERPENIFAGRDFRRGGEAVNFVPAKFGYSLANEGGDRNRFAADVWANFQPVAALNGKGWQGPKLG